jgi:hypothetical protein
MLQVSSLLSWRTKTNSNYLQHGRGGSSGAVVGGYFLAFLAHQVSFGRDYRSLAVSSMHLPVSGFPVTDETTET